MSLIYYKAYCRPIYMSKNVGDFLYTDRKGNNAYALLEVIVFIGAVWLGSIDCVGISEK